MVIKKIKVKLLDPEYNRFNTQMAIVFSFFKGFSSTYCLPNYDLLMNSTRLSCVLSYNLGDGVIVYNEYYYYTNKNHFLIKLYKW